MAGREVAVTRPLRWDSPFDQRMRKVDVDHLLHLEPFRRIDPAAFPDSLPLADIFLNDARIVRCLPGDLIVREGDYGHSALLILQGRVRVAIERISPETLGRRPHRPRGWWKTWGQLWRRRRLPEVRTATTPPTHLPIPDGDGILGCRLVDDRPTIFLMDVPRVLDRTGTAVLERGEVFGELAAITRSPRTATAFAEGEATLVEIRWQGLRDLMRWTDVIRQHVESLYRQNSLLVHLRETPLLNNLPPAHLEEVARATQFQSHGRFDWNEAFDPAAPRRRGDAIIDEPLIAEEATRAAGLLLIRSGFARQSHRHGHGHRTRAYLGRGQSFGWSEALEAFHTAQPSLWRTSLRALGYVDVLLIPMETVVRHIVPHIDAKQLAALKATGSAVPETLDQSAPEPDSLPIAQGLLEFLVERRLINGREAMVIDLDRCTRCDDCVRACAATHDGNPRFVREGPRHGPLQIAQACMHCIDPVCMIGCPTGAIGRDESTGTMTVNDLTCIGCGTCAMSCPYDNIRMVEIRDSQEALLIDEASGRPLVKATKCDLCSDLPGGPACTNACPHDALVRLDLTNLDQVAGWVNR